MAENGVIEVSYLIIGAALIDLIVGDPKRLPHPVEAMGFLINQLRRFIEHIGKDNSKILEIGGIAISIILISTSTLIGWSLERLIFIDSYLLKVIGYLLLSFALASTIAAKSLNQSVKRILNSLKNYSSKDSLDEARKYLSEIVGRDVKELNQDEILRASAESISENAVDGIFSPLFWMFIGSTFWLISESLPGPLSLALCFKSISTIDSMIGYKIGRLKWLGKSGARLDDVLVFIPCRIVVMTLPLINNSWLKFPQLVKSAWVEGSKDISPNSGLSEAIFSHCCEIRMGGENFYNNKVIHKPILGGQYQIPDIEGVNRLMIAIIKLEVAWLISFLIFFLYQS